MVNQYLPYISSVKLCNARSSLKPISAFKHFPLEKPPCTVRSEGITVPWSSWLKLGTEQRAVRHDAQKPCRPHVHPTAAGPSLSACSAEFREKLTPQAQTGRAQAG